MASMSFSMQVADFIAKTKGNVDLVTRAITLKVDNKVMHRSPVGDAKYWKHKPPPGYTGGRFRANWQLSIGSPVAGVRDLIDKDGSATIAAHGSVISTAKAGDVIYLVNNLPYARRIEEGWSRQAPVGVVMLTVVEFRTIVDNAVNGVRDGTTASEFAQGYSSYKL